MPSEVHNLAGSLATKAPIPAGVFDQAAARVRQSGLMLAVLDANGRIAFSDGKSGPFFERFASPLLHRYCDASCLPELTATRAQPGNPNVHATVPGLIFTTAPIHERKQAVGAYILAGRAENFSLGEDVLRECTLLGLDAAWLKQEADLLPVWGTEAILRQMTLVSTMIADQNRLDQLEHERDSLSGQLANMYEELSLIYQISSGMKINRGATEFFKQACVDVMEVIGVAGMGVVIRDETQQQDPVLYGSLAMPPGGVQQLSDQLMTVMQARTTPLLINDLAGNPSFVWLAGSARQLIAVPLMRQDKLLGCLYALDKITGEFDTVDAKLLTSISNESAIYLENAILFEDVRGLMMGLLHSLTSAVDAKDAYTCGHSERVALLSRELALRAGLGEQFADRVYMAGLLHDVGKIGVPESVLSKAGRLTEEEFEQIKKHPEMGAKILKDIKQVEDIIPGVMYHHERFDGKGYPAGLVGEAIPVMGRIICLADCFDAMTSSRTYRKALPLEVALEEIRKCAGTQFDPQLAQAFLKIDQEMFARTLLNHREQSKSMIHRQQRWVA